MMLVHTCCTNCALNLTKSIQTEREIPPSDILLYYYNPNIHPESEWHARRKALVDTYEPLGYQVVIENWRPRDYFHRINKLSIKHKNKQDIRCPICYQIRLETTFQYAYQHDIDTVTTTMLTSPHMDAAVIQKIGQALALQYDVKFYIPQKLDCKLCTKGFYKQNYCGCIYSLNQKLEEKYRHI